MSGERPRQLDLVSPGAAFADRRLRGVAGRLPATGCRWALSLKGRWTRALCVYTAVALLWPVAYAVSAGDDGSAGFVFDVKGAWLSTHSGRAVRVTDSVFPNEQITPPQDPKPDNSISISLYDGTPVKRRCPSHRDCDPAYHVPDVAARSPCS